MAFNRRAFWRFLHDNDNGSFYPLVLAVGANYQESDHEELRQVISYLGSFAGNNFLNLKDNTGNIVEGYFIHELGKTKTLKDFSVRITDNGRDYYQKAYLKQDEADSQKVVTDSILSTNRFIKLTFGAIVAGMILQGVSIVVTHLDAEKALKQTQPQQEQRILTRPTEGKIYLNDSAETTLENHQK